MLIVILKYQVRMDDGSDVLIKLKSINFKELYSRLVYPQGIETQGEILSFLVNILYGARLAPYVPSIFVLMRNIGRRRYP